MSVQIDVDVVGFIDKTASITTDDAGNLILTTGDFSGSAAQVFIKKTGEILVGTRRLAFADELGSGGTTPAEPEPEPEPTPTPTPTPTPVAVPAWTRPTLSNGWTQRAHSVTTPTEVPGFRVVGHRVELTGDLEGSGVANLTVQPGETCLIFRLPVGARPLVHAKTLPVLCGGNTLGTLKVFPDGQVVFLAGSLAGLVSLHGVSFPMD